MCQERCCIEKREREDAWKMLCELYRVLASTGAGNRGTGRTHAYSRKRS